MPVQIYLNDDRDFDDPDLHRLKLDVRSMNRRGLRTGFLRIVSLTLSLAGHAFIPG